MFKIYHLNNVVEIQRKFIDGEIDRAELDKLLKQETERYGRVLMSENESIQQNISKDIMNDKIMHELTKNIDWRKKNGKQ